MPVKKKKQLQLKSFDDEKIEQLLSPKKKMELQVDGLLSGLGESFNLLVLSNKANHEAVTNSLLKKFSLLMQKR